MSDRVASQPGRKRRLREAAEAPVSRPRAKPGTIALEAQFARPTASQGAAIGDALRLLAAWAARAARQSPDNVRGESGRAHSDLDLGRPGSDECVAVPSHDEG
jgi:hypothetical protein